MPLCHQYGEIGMPRCHLGMPFCHQRGRVLQWSRGVSHVGWVKTCVPPPPPN